MTIECEVLEPRWDSPCVVAAPGESLTKQVAEQCRGYPTIVVKQAWRRLPWAEVLYSCEAYFFDMCKEFRGEKWSSHDRSINNKLIAAKQYGLRLVGGDAKPGFSRDPSLIHYGMNSGFQAVNMAIHWLRGPRKRIVLVGFDMKGGYFYGPHPRPARASQFHSFLPHFETAAKDLPEGVEIVNATPNSALRSFPMMDLAAALT